MMFWRASGLPELLFWWRFPTWPEKLAAMEREVAGMEGTIFPGRLQVSDEGTGDIVHLDMYRANETTRMRISVSREVLRVYAQRLLEAANREVPG